MVRPFAVAVAFAMASPAPPRTVRPPAAASAPAPAPAVPAVPAAPRPAAPSRGYWLQAIPADEGEAAVYAAATDPTLAGTAQGARTLRDLADKQRGATAGLARLAAGLILLDKEQYAEAEPLLLDRDIEKTKLEDHAVKGLAELYEKTGAFSKAAEQYDKLAARADPNPFRCAART